MRKSGTFVVVALVASAACAESPDENPLPPVSNNNPTSDPNQGDGDGEDGDGDGAEDWAPASIPNATADGIAIDDPEDEGTSSGQSTLIEGALDDDLMVMEAPPAPIDVDNIDKPLAGGASILYINFGGPIIRTCSSFCNDARTNHSTLIKQTFARSSVDFLPYTGTSRRSAIVSAVRGYFARYNVVVTTRRPTSGVYTMAVVSPSNVGSSSRRGTSYLDCNNGYKTDIAFIYRIGGTSAARIARYITHEVGHTFGLMHVTSTSDLMQYGSSGTRWTTATLDTARNPPGYTCLPGQTRQNEPRILERVLGLRP